MGEVDPMTDNPETPETLDDIEQEMSAQEVEEQEIAAMVDQILRVESAIERVQAQRDKQIERIGRAAQYQLRSLGDEIAALRSYSEPLIQAWLERHPPTKGRTRHLSTGSVGFRNVPARVSVEDRDALIAWAKASAQWALKQKEPDVDAREVISRCGHGDLPPGLIRTPERTDLVISPPKKT